LISLLGQVSSRSIRSRTGLRFLALAVLILLGISSVLLAATRGAEQRPEDGLCRSQKKPPLQPDEELADVLPAHLQRVSRIVTEDETLAPTEGPYPEEFWMSIR